MLPLVMVLKTISVVEKRMEGKPGKKGAIMVCIQRCPWLCEIYCRPGIQVVACCGVDSRLPFLIGHTWCQNFELMRRSAYL